MKKIIFAGLLVLSSFSFVNAQQKNIQSQKPRYENCCICQFNDTNDAVGASASESCNIWLKKQSCELKTKIRSSLPLEPKNIFPYYEYVTKPFCGNIIFQREGHGAPLDRSKSDVFACLRMMGAGGKLRFTDMGCSTFENVFEVEEAAYHLSKFVSNDQNIIWTANQSHSTGITKMGREHFNRDIETEFLHKRSADGNILRKPLSDPTYARVVTFLPKVANSIAVPYGNRLNTPTTAVIKKSGVEIILPKCSEINKESAAYFGNTSKCSPKHGQLFCDEDGVTQTRTCCGPIGNLRWISTPNGFCPDAIRLMPAVTPQF